MASSFRQNLRSELNYQDITVKELSAKTGIPKPTLDCYLGSRQTMPPADIAVKIAQALNVSVEFLVTGKSELASNKKNNEKLKQIIKNLEKLTEEELSYALSFSQAAVKQKPRN